MSIAHLKNTLQQYQENDLYRERFLIEHRDISNIIIKGKTLINFCSSDYLNITQHPDIKKSFIKGVETYGLGSGASSLISGYFKSHYQLEEAFSEFLNREKSILFNSGYHANLGVLTALGQKNSVVIADKLCHASLIDGLILSRKRFYRYRHNDISHAKNLLQNHPKNSLLITESVFSMQGNLANITELVSLANEFQTTLIVDDAHGIGVLGQHGKGLCEHAKLSQKEVPCLIVPLGKGLGSFGAIVSGDKTIIETLLQFARTYCYTTSLPPALSCATLTALRIVQQESWRREKLLHLSQLFNTASKERKLKLSSFDFTPIKCIMVGSNKVTIQIQKELLKKGFFVSCIRPPTVPNNTARIRISLNCMHSEKQIIQLLDELFILLKNHESKTKN